jgi:hypothetical protein
MTTKEVPMDKKIEHSIPVSFYVVLSSPAGSSPTSIRWVTPTISPDPETGGY